MIREPRKLWAKIKSYGDSASCNPVDAADKDTPTRLSPPTLPLDWGLKMTRQKRNIGRVQPRCAWTMAADNKQLRDGCHSLYAALGRVLEQVDQQLVAEQEEHRRFLQKLNDSSKLGDTENSILIQRITDLKRQAASIEPIASQVAPSSDLLQTHKTSTNLVASNVSSSAFFSKTKDFSALSVKYYKLQKRFNALSSNFKLAKNALARRKAQRDEWADYASKLARAISVAEFKHGIKIVDLKKRHSSAMNDPPFEVSSNHDAADAQDQRLQDDGNKESMRNDSEFSTGKYFNPKHSDFTQSEAPGGLDPQLTELLQKPPNSPTYKPAGPPSDALIFFSERKVRKRKRIRSDSDQVGLQVKSEPTDDTSPTMSAIHSASNTQKSLDLGDIEQKINTPRKPKGLALVTPEIFKADTGSNISSVPHIATPVPQLDLLPEQEAPQNNLPIVASLSANVRNTKSIKDEANVRARERDLGYTNSVLAKHECGHGVQNSLGKSHDSSTKASMTIDRISVLLPTPNLTEHDSIISHPARRRRQWVSASVNNLSIPERRELPFQKGSVPATKSTRVRQLQESPASMVTRSSVSSRDNVISAFSLRKKPLSELRLDDFKLNRQANHGRDFAYAEVVRNRGERACLPGCTGEHCCGKQFRALAHSQRPDPPLTHAQQMEEQKLLKEYLGDEAYRLASMTGDEKDELWLQAKTRQLANRYGKHRHCFSSRQSPPGFWNADFPDTQELEADRVEAAAREKKAITERQREAMRPGGRWVFKDE